MWVVRYFFMVRNGYFCLPRDIAGRYPTSVGPNVLSIALYDVGVGQEDF